MSEHKVKVTNTARGPRQIINPKGGITIQPGESWTGTLDKKDLDGIEIYVQIGELRITPPDPDPESSDSADFAETLQLDPEFEAPESAAAGDIVPAHFGEDDEKLPPEIDDEKPTHVQHLGFGRWFGMHNGNKVTDAMNSAEAEIFAAEHGIPKGAAPEPSEEPVEDTEAQPPHEDTPPVDEVAEEAAEETAEEVAEEAADEE